MLALPAALRHARRRIPPSLADVCSRDHLPPSSTPIIASHVSARGPLPLYATNFVPVNILLSQYTTLLATAQHIATAISPTIALTCNRNLLSPPLESNMRSPSHAHSQHSGNNSSPTSQPQQNKSQAGSKNLFQNIIFGGTAGVIGQTCIFPLYTIKTHLHLYPGRYNSILHCARKIIQHDSIRGLYKGLPPALSGVFPEKAIKLSVNDYLSATLARKDGTISIPMSMLAGAGAGLSQVVATNPMEMLMINMQSAAAKGRAIGTLQMIRHLGLPGLYKGTAATLFRDIPFSIVFFSMNSTLRQSLTEPNGHLPMSKVFLAGIASGSSAATLSTPMDVIKTRLQASAGDAASTHASKPVSAPGLADAVRPGAPKVPSTAVPTRDFSSSSNRTAAPTSGADKIRYTGIAHCARHIYATEGVRGFFAGVGPRILIISPLFGITLFFYDIQRRLQASGRI